MCFCESVDVCLCLCVSLGCVEANHGMVCLVIASIIGTTGGVDVKCAVLCHMPWPCGMGHKRMCSISVGQAHAAFG